MKILLATYNKHKREEIKSLLKGFRDITVLTLNDLKVEPPMIVEDGKTFRQNAVKKAVTISKFFDGLVLADDSGLEVEALYGRPGVRSARFARTKATDKENVDKLLTLMRKIPEHKRNARFVCCIALSENGVLLGSYQGEVKGAILYETRGNNGFGYDPVFVPKGYGKTFAEMDSTLKNKISHRGLALVKFKKAISKIAGTEGELQQELEFSPDTDEKSRTEVRKPDVRKKEPGKIKRADRKTGTPASAKTRKKPQRQTGGKTAPDKKRKAVSPLKKDAPVRKKTEAKKITAKNNSASVKKTTVEKTAKKKTAKKKPVSSKKRNRKKT
jgi:XTP/dITP diphosphohydrolase